ncbi:MAG: CDP-alcohol phosphatidyltransferase family protein [Eubacteriales bacterium]|nr:CDP-alcohol phosphatidyltransferase family protein [Eubacteriales bacterium]
MEERWKGLVNAPNVLTIIRLLLIPVMWHFLNQDCMMCALAVFCLAGFTDVVDGYLARKNSQITWFGKLADPLADKLMTLTLMVGLYKKGILPVTPFIILFIKELLMLIGAVFLLKQKQVVYSKAIGKLAQFTIFLSLVLSFFYEYFNSIDFPLHIIMLWAGVSLALAALLYYAHQNIFSYFKNK